MPPDVVYCLSAPASTVARVLVPLAEGGYVAAIQDFGEPDRSFILHRFASDRRQVGDDPPFDADLTGAVGTSLPKFVASSGGNLTMVFEDTGLAGGIGALTLRTPVWGSTR